MPKSIYVSINNAFELLQGCYDPGKNEFDWHDMDWDKYFDLLNLIKSDRGQAIDLVARYVVSPQMPERLFAASLAGTIMNPVEDTEQDEAKLLIILLAKMSEAEESTDVLEAIATALGYPYMSEVRQTLLRLSYHEDVDVRRAATVSLGSLMVEDDKDVAARLHELENDPDPEIRDWAQFGLEPIED